MLLPTTLLTFHCFDWYCKVSCILTDTPSSHTKKKTSASWLKCFLELLWCRRARGNRADKTLHSYDGKFARSTLLIFLAFLMCSRRVFTPHLFGQLRRFVKVDIEKIFRKPLAPHPRSANVSHKYSFSHRGDKDIVFTQPLKKII